MKILSAADRVRISYNIAKTLHQSSRLGEAIAAYTDALALSPQADIEARVIVNREAAYTRRGRFEDAYSGLTAVIDGPGMPPDQQFMARINRVDVRFESDLSGAIADLEAAMAAGYPNEEERLPKSSDSTSHRWRKGLSRQSLGRCADLSGF